jgi:O-antigen/teichoic acid export membrane protein
MNLLQRGGAVLQHARAVFQHTWSAWKADRLLRAVMRNTSYLFSANTITLVLSSFYGLLSALLLGPAEYGVLGMVILYAITINRLLSFRMSEVVIKYAGQYRAQGHIDQAAAVIKAGGITEAVTSLLAFSLLVLSAPLAARYLIKDANSTNLLIFYGWALLANLVAETSTAVLQIGGHFRIQAIISLVQTVLTGIWILVAFLTKAGLGGVVTAYLAGKTLMGVGLTLAALRYVKPLLGKNWWKASMWTVKEWKQIFRFAISTNLNVTIQMVIRDSEVLWLGLFATSTEQIGYFKFAQALMSAMLMPITPFISTTFPELTRSVANHAWEQVRMLLRRTTILSAIWTAGCAAGMLLLGRWLLALLKHGEYLPSFPAILILLAGYGFSNIFFWNRTLLLAMGKPYFPLVVTALTGLAKILLMFFLVPRYGYLAQSWLLSGFFIVSVTIILIRGARELRQSTARFPEPIHPLPKQVPHEVNG